MTDPLVIFNPSGERARLKRLHLAGGDPSARLAALVEA
jgi:hypothetical protein